ncbi:hypothetical protein EZV62_020483 [Acer yangbiense]|uniref:DUF4283 domain-containing protein n=1 Tax=Acer yangbiense TaxID=1000413 RepID=A0A5C7HE59_9ROSI|nr:hypothetical protein EZV62_020483 [Acer yangbiense]
MMDADEVASLCAALSLKEKYGPLMPLQVDLKNKGEKLLALRLVGKILSNKLVNREEIGIFLGKMIGDFKEVDVGPSGECVGKFLRVRVVINVDEPLRRMLRVDVLRDGTKTNLLLRGERSRGGVASDSKLTSVTDSERMTQQETEIGSNRRIVPEVPEPAKDRAVQVVGSNIEARTLSRKLGDDSSNNDGYHEKILVNGKVSKNLGEVFNKEIVVSTVRDSESVDKEMEENVKVISSVQGINKEAGPSMVGKAGVDVVSNIDGAKLGISKEKSSGNSDRKSEGVTGLVRLGSLDWAGKQSSDDRPNSPELGNRPIITTMDVDFGMDQGHPTVKDSSRMLRWLWTS